MKGHLKRLQKTVFAGTCVLALLCPMTIVHADELDNMETQSSDLQSELDNVNNELLEMGARLQTMKYRWKQLMVRLRRLRSSC